MDPPIIEKENCPRGNGWRHKTFEIIFGHHTPAGLAFDLFLLVAILISVIIVCVETLPQFQITADMSAAERQAIQAYQKWFLFSEVAFTVLFTVEYGLRVWCVENPWKYVFSFFGMVDLLAVIPSLIGLVLYFSGAIDTKEVVGAAGSYTVIRSLRLLRVFRLIRIGKWEKESSELAGAIWKARSKVIVFILVVMITVVMAGTLMYELEHTRNDKFKSIPEGIYWAIVTMTTVGYGDIVPTTFLGKFISSLLILIGYSLIIVPTGFVSAEVVGSKGLLQDDHPRSDHERRPDPTPDIDHSRTCDSCQLRGHQRDAQFCRACGNQLIES